MVESWNFRPEKIYGYRGSLLQTLANTGDTIKKFHAGENSTPGVIYHVT